MSRAARVYVREGHACPCAYVVGRVLEFRVLLEAPLQSAPANLQSVSITVLGPLSRLHLADYHLWAWRRLKGACR